MTVRVVLKRHRIKSLININTLFKPAVTDFFHASGGKQYCHIKELLIYTSFNYQATLAFIWTLASGLLIVISISTTPEGNVFALWLLNAPAVSH